MECFAAKFVRLIVLLLSINCCQRSRADDRELCWRAHFTFSLQEPCFDLEFRTISHRKPFHWLRRSEWIHSEASKHRGNECNSSSAIYRRLQWPHNRRLQRQSRMPRRVVHTQVENRSDASFHWNVLRFSSLEAQCSTLFSVCKSSEISQPNDPIAVLFRTTKFSYKLMSSKRNLIRMQLIKPPIPNRTVGFRALESIALRLDENWTFLSAKRTQWPARSKQFGRHWSVPSRALGSVSGLNCARSVHFLC